MHAAAQLWLMAEKVLIEFVLCSVRECDEWCDGTVHCSLVISARKVKWFSVEEHTIPDKSVGDGGRISKSKHNSEKVNEGSEWCVCDCVQ